MTNQEKAQKIREIDGVTNANVWDRVPGKARIYIDTIKMNGGRSWNGGVGYTNCYVDLMTGELTMTGEAGARTREWHRKNETAEKILAAIAE